MAGQHSMRDLLRIKKGRMLVDNKLHQVRQIWDDKQLDFLLEEYLTKNTPWFDLMERIDRTGPGIQKAVYRLAIRDHARPHFSEYKPAKRTRRDNKPFTDRERWMLSIATSPRGIENAAHLPHWIGKILGRDSGLLWTYMKELAKRQESKKRMLIKIGRKDETEEERVARLVQKILMTTFRKCIDAVVKEFEEV